MISKEELHDMYFVREMSQRKIANEIGVSLGTVQNWMKLYKIESRTISEAKLKGARKPSKEYLENMYRGQGMSQREITKEIGVCPMTVNNWMKEHEIEARTLSEARINGDFTGERSGKWQGGISFEPYCNKFNNQFKEAVRVRDDYICQLCGCIQESNSRKMDVHHIHYDKENCYPDVVALCQSCNSKVNSNRDYWEQFFENQLLERGLYCWSLS